MEGLAGFDLFALMVLFVSGVMALMRGFVREALTITAFVGAALAALWSQPVMGAVAREFIASPLIANLIAMALVFLIVYLAISFVTSSLSRSVKEGEEVSTIDRTLGFVFGVVRGILLLGLIVLVFKNTLPGAQPEWLRGARVYPLAEATARLLQSLAPEGTWAGGTAGEQRENLDDDPIGRLIERTNEDPNG
ncbi:CvpA family protein [Marinicauda algicola]|uniref:CvpA family protein n=1 Tax=Marinicauda algicola TaxID=2029849 RepID=A0A4S2GYW0_9PROT|nr:CvpA family protein [Marinicauda algicola]TGY87972.1 CvpA family protein [Marinicauda algicola]